MSKTDPTKCKQCKNALPQLAIEKGYFYCSSICLDARPIRKPELNAASLRHGTAIALARRTVEIDLLQAGYNVFTAISSSSSCDLIAIKAPLMFSICVRCAYTRKSGTVFCNRSASDACDTYAMVTADLEVTYDPPFSA